MRYDVWYRRRDQEDSTWYRLWSSLDWVTACRRVINARAMGREAEVVPEGDRP